MTLVTAMQSRYGRVKYFRQGLHDDFVDMETILATAALRCVRCATRGRSDRKMLDGAIDHVAVAVHDIRRAMPLFVDSLGGEFLYAGENKHQGFRWAQFRFPHGGKIELVTPLTPAGFVARFLARRGEAVHHMTFKVPDIQRAMEHLAARGVPLINVWTDDPDWKEAFIHPKDAHGVLIQIAQSRFSDEEVVRHHLEPHGPDGHRHVTLADILAAGPGTPPTQDPTDPSPM